MVCQLIETYINTTEPNEKLEIREGIEECRATFSDPNFWDDMIEGFIEDDITPKEVIYKVLSHVIFDYLLAVKHKQEPSAQTQKRHIQKVIMAFSAIIAFRQFLQTKKGLSLSADRDY